jgi:hypothetical protein
VPDQRTPTRRQLLAAVGTVAVAGVALPGCASPPGRSPATDPGDAPDTADTALARRAAQASAGLVAAYRATARRHRDLRRGLAPLAAHHAEHLAVLAADDAPAAGVARVPTGRAAALLALLRREQAVARQRRAATAQAVSGDLARILASVLACQAQHEVLLGRLLR